MKKVFFKFNREVILEGIRYKADKGYPVSEKNLEKFKSYTGKNKDQALGFFINSTGKQIKDIP